jgi:hypothetical protein
MVHAPDTGRLRSLIARPFKLGRETRRSRIARDPFDRLEPLFDPTPLTETREPDPARSASSSESQRATEIERVPHAPRGTVQRTPLRTRYGLPGALPSEVFGPYARSAEAELNAPVDADQETEPDAGEAADSLVDRLSRALSALDPAIEKISEGNGLAAVGNSQESHRRAPTNPPKEDEKLMKRNEPLAQDTSHGPSKMGAAPPAGRRHATRR